MRLDEQAMPRPSPSSDALPLGRVTHETKREVKLAIGWADLARGARAVPRGAGDGAGDHRPRGSRAS
jgi:hypothetical protein